MPEMKESEQYKSRGGLAEEVTSEQTSEGDESGSYGRVWRKGIPGSRRNCMCKGPGAGLCLACKREN